MISYQLTRVDGVPVVLSPMPSVESVSIGLWFRAGSRIEPLPMHGAAHFLEHMLFKGTRKRNALDISREVESVGGDVNAFTAEEMTCYYVRSGAGHLARMLDVLFDMLQSSAFPRDEVERERGVILEEIKMYADQPNMVVAERLQEAMWPGTPLGRTVIGTPESLQSMKRAGLMEFWRRHYRPETLVVAVSGNFDTAALQALLRRHLAAWRIPAGRGKSRPVLAQGIRQKLAVTALDQPVQQSNLALGYYSCPRGDPRRYAVKLMSIMLGENMSSRLFQSVRERHGLAYSIHTGTSHFSDTGSFTIQVGLDTDQLGKAIRVIGTELGRFLEKGPSRAELQRAKDYAIGQMQLGLENTINQMMWTGEAVTGLGRVVQVPEVIESLMSVDVAQIRAVARETLERSPVIVSCVGPGVKEAALRRLSRPLRG